MSSSAASAPTAEQTPTATPAALALLFKRKGHFDRIRRELHDHFPGPDFERQVHAVCRSLVERRERNGSLARATTDKVTLQRRLLREVESHDALFRPIRDGVQRKLLRSHEYDDKIARVLESILDESESELQRLVGSGKQQEKQQATAKASAPTNTADLFHDILSLAAAPVKLVAEEEPEIAPFLPVFKPKAVTSTPVVDKRPSDVENVTTKVPIVKEEPRLAPKNDEATRSQAADAPEQQRMDVDNNSEDDKIQSSTDEEERRDRRRSTLRSRQHAQESESSGEETEAARTDALAARNTVAPRAKRTSLPAHDDAASSGSDSSSTTSSSLSSMSSDDDSDADSETEELPREEYSQVWLRGQKLAALGKDQSVSTASTCHVCIVRDFNPRTGLYTVSYTDAKRGTAQLPFDELLHFNHNEKTFHVGDRVFSLFRSKQQRGLSSEFYRATVVRVGGSVVHVEFDEGRGAAVLKYSELFKV